MADHILGRADRVLQLEVSQLGFLGIAALYRLIHRIHFGLKLALGIIGRDGMGCLRHLQFQLAGQRFHKVHT